MMLLSALIFFAFASQVTTQMQSMKYQMHVSRKSRSNAAPLETGYVYSQVNNDPGKFTAFGNHASYSIPSDVDQKQSDLMTFNFGDSFRTNFGDKFKNSYNFNSGLDPLKEITGDVHGESYSGRSIYDTKSNVKHDILNGDNVASSELTSGKKLDDKLLNINDPMASDFSTPSPPKISSTEGYPPGYPEPISSRLAADYAIAKADAEYNSKFLPSKMKSDAMYDRLKSFMHYRAPRDVNDYAYDSLHDYHIDDNDIRTDSRSSYDYWPYFHYTPYDYESMKLDSEIQTIKDKRYVNDNARKIIPVYENHDYDNANAHVDYSNENLYSLNSDKRNDEDPLTFKGLDWDKGASYETNTEPNPPLVNGKRHRRKPIAYNYYPNGNEKHHSGHKYGDSSTEKSYHKNKKFNKYEQGDSKKSNHNEAYSNSENNEGAYKNFLDTFTNKFNNEDLKKKTKYVLKKNQDKGEKRKGFRRVYHKDEYQEDNEFYDNNNHHANAEEEGGSSIHKGGSKAYLKSQAQANIGNNSNAYNKDGSSHNNNYEKHHKGHGAKKGYSKDFTRYADSSDHDSDGYGHNYLP